MFGHIFVIPPYPLKTKYCEILSPLIMSCMGSVLLRVLGASLGGVKDVEM